MNRRHIAVTGMLPCPVVVLTVAAGGRRDAMAATTVFVSEDPPLLSVSVAKHLLTHDLIEQAGEFVVNVAAPEQVDLVRQVGSAHGRDVDKFEQFKLATEPSEALSTSRIAGSYAWLECKVVASHKVAAYTVFTAEVVAHGANEGLGPLVWHRGHFFALGPPVA